FVQKNTTPKGKGSSTKQKQQQTQIRQSIVLENNFGGNTMTFRRLLLISILLFGAAGVSGNAQSTNAGDIRGSVTDPTGALIPGVTVTVLNVDTGVAKDFTTNQDGLYDTSSIVAGNYKLTFKREGFEELVRGPITLQVGFTTVNAELKVGSTQQLVTVTTNVPLL